MGGEDAVGCKLQENFFLKLSMSLTMGSYEKEVTRLKFVIPKGVIRI